MAAPASRMGPASTSGSSQHAPFALPVTGVCGGKSGAGTGAAPPEWALVELQGELEPPAGSSGLDFEAGTLTLSATVKEEREIRESAGAGGRAKEGGSRSILRLFFFFNLGPSLSLSPSRPPPFPSQTPGAVELTVGIHLLEGSIVPLKKPFAVLEKRGGRGDADPSGAAASPSGAAPLPGSLSRPSPPPLPLASPVRYEVVGVIRRKCLFKARPRALISGPGALARQVEAAAAKAAAREAAAAEAAAEVAGGVEVGAMVE